MKNFMYTSESGRIIEGKMYYNGQKTLLRKVSIEEV